MGRAFYTELPERLKFLLVACCDHANDDGFGVSVGQEVLAFKVGTSSRSVRDHMKALIEGGFLERLEERHPLYGTHQHRVIVDALPSTEEIREIKVRVTGGRPELLRRSGRSRQTGPEEVAGRAAEAVSDGPTSQVSEGAFDIPQTGPEEVAGHRPEDPHPPTGSLASGYPSASQPPEIALASASAEGKSANEILAETLLLPTSTSQYLLSRLAEDVDDAWFALVGRRGNGALMKLGQAFGAAIVLEAIGYMREEYRSDVHRPYAYLESVCVRIQAERQEVSA